MRISYFIVAFLLFPLGSRAEITASVIRRVKIHESHSYGYFPSLQVLSSGALICDFSLDADKDEVETNFWGYVVSTDGGRTWGMRNTEGMIFREAAYTRNPSLPDGSLLMVAGLLVPVRGDFRTLAGTSVRIGSNGTEICLRRNITVHFPAPAARDKIDDTVAGVCDLGGGKIKEAGGMDFSGTLIAAQGGGWLATMYGKLEGDQYYRTGIAVSDAAGLNWRYESTVAGDAEAIASLKTEGEERMEGFCEPRMVRLADGRLFLVMRRGSNNRMYRSWSSDEGGTWTRPGSIGFKGVKPNLWRMKSGILALTTGRPDPVSIRFSGDGGRSWSAPTFLPADARLGEGRPQPSTCYTGIVELPDHSLLVVYDHLPDVKGWGLNANDRSSMNTIWGAFIKVRE